MNKQINPVIKSDILRYKKNKFGANLALLGLACGVIYFLTLYSQVKNGNYYYTWWIAADVIYNLFFLLFVFLFSEQVKGYDRSMFPLQLIVGVLQFARIFWLPLCGLNAKAIDWWTFIVLTVALAASGALIILSALIGYWRSKEVSNFNKKIESGEVDVDATLKELDRAESGEVA